jgi:hypothetical protein
LIQFEQIVSLRDPEMSENILAFHAVMFGHTIPSAGAWRTFALVKRDIKLARFGHARAVKA